MVARTGIGLLNLSIIFASTLCHGSSRPSFASANSNGMSPFWKWETLESPHFKISYPSTLAEPAEKIAQYFEQTHAALAPLFAWEPLKKTQIILLDNQDSANGMTSPIARYGIVLWITPPDPQMGLQVYDDWYKMLVIHEYTHLLNMDTTHDLWKTLRYVFGDTLLPNSVLPGWMLEGLAVYMETRFTQAGRGRSAYYHALLRSAVEQKVLGTPDFITLNKLTGGNPYFPSGDTIYQFGYHLMYETTENAEEDQKDQNFGKLSKTSGKSLPFLIDNYITQVKKRSWQEIWNSWIQKATKRSEEALQTLHAQPTTPSTPLLTHDWETSNTISGISASSDGKLLAYTLSSADRRSGLYLQDTQNHKNTRLLDKKLGTGSCFSVFSLIYSRLHQIGQYLTYSDLEAYHLKTKKTHWLTHQLRARDPALSADQKHLTFTLTEHQTTGLALADLLETEDDLRLENVRTLWMPKQYERVSNPVFSQEGTRIFFSHHPSSKPEENILMYDLKTQTTTVLVSNGHYNRFPTIPPSQDPDRCLYFVSDQTGVDNLYRYSFETEKTFLISNVTTALNYPQFRWNGKNSVLYAGILSYTGWNLSEVSIPDRKEKSLPTESLTLKPPPAPSSKKLPDLPAPEFSKSPYSPWPSLLPRVWGPLIDYQIGGFQVGAAVLGFDAIDTHRYSLGASYNTHTQFMDWQALYSTRALGPNITFSNSMISNYAKFTEKSLVFERQWTNTISLSYPFLKTYSHLTPSIAYNFIRFEKYQKINQTSSTFVSKTPFAQAADLLWTYSNLETSPLGITYEAGHKVQLATRNLMLPGQMSWKNFFLGDSYFRLTPHTILNPQIKGLWATQINPHFPQSGSYLQGRVLKTLFNALPSDNFNQLSIRGYPNLLSNPAFFAGSGSIDLSFPLVRIFQGWGTMPVFLKNLYGWVFAEANYVQSIPVALPSAGLGLRLTTEVFYLPLTLSTEYHRGFQEIWGGKNDLFFQILASNLLSF